MRVCAVEWPRWKVLLCLNLSAAADDDDGSDEGGAVKSVILFNFAATVKISLNCF